MFSEEATSVVKIWKKAWLTRIMVWRDTMLKIGSQRDHGPILILLVAYSAVKGSTECPSKAPCKFMCWFLNFCCSVTDKECSCNLFSRGTCHQSNLNLCHSYAAQNQLLFSFLSLFFLWGHQPCPSANPEHAPTAHLAPSLSEESQPHTSMVPGCGLSFLCMNFGEHSRSEYSILWSLSIRSMRPLARAAPVCFIYCVTFHLRVPLIRYLPGRVDGLGNSDHNVLFSILSTSGYPHHRHSCEMLHSLFCDFLQI